MADRLAQYPIMNSNFNPNLLQQQQISQSQQQQLQVDSQSTPAYTNPEHGRMWQQFHQFQNPYRSQSGSEMKGPQLNPQMTDALRSQTIARMQGQQQIAQQFGMPQQPPFHDQPSQQPQPHLPPTLTNMGMGNASQVQQPLNSRNAMLAFQASNPGHMPRQLEMTGLVPKQQQANGPINFPPRMTQQHQHQANLNPQSGQNQSSQSDIFSSPPTVTSDGIHSSPSHLSQPPSSIGNNPSVAQPNSQGLPAGRRPMTFHELREQLSSQRAGMSDAIFITKMQSITNDTKHRKDQISKVLQAMSQLAPYTMSNGPGGSVGAMNPASGPSQSGPIQLGPSQQSWIPPVPTQQQEFGNSPMRQIVPRGSSNIHPSPLQPHSQPNHSQQQNLVPPRSAPQQFPGQNTGQMSPNAPSQSSFQIGGQAKAQLRSEHNSHSSFMQIPPLEKARFDSAYKNYCATKGIHHDTRLMSVDDRPIDLHSLHVQVMSEGSGAKVQQMDLWPVIAARMGFVQFPGTESEPAKSGPGAAQHIAHVYNEYLSSFDLVYVQSVMESKRKMQAAAAIHHAQTQGIVGGSQSTARTIANPQQMQTMVKYASLPVAELRSKGVPDNVILYVEKNRAQLLHSQKMQQQWRGGLVNPPGHPPSSPQSPKQDRVPAGGSSQFQPQQNPTPLQRPPRFSAAPGGSNLDPQFPRPPQVSFNNAVNSSPVNQLSKDQLQHAKQVIVSFKHEFTTRTMPNMASQIVPDDQKREFNRMLEQLHRYVVDMEPSLALYFLLLKQEDVIRKLIAIMVTVQHQRFLLSSPTPKYIVDLSMLRTMMHQMQQASEVCNTLLSSLVKQQQPPTELPVNQPGQTISQSRPQVLPQRPPALPTPPQLPPPPPMRHVSLMPPPTGKKKALSIQSGPSTSTPSAPLQTPMVSTPTPPLPGSHVSTPVAHVSTPTPVASSPQGTKSPQTKAGTKPKSVPPTKRKASKHISPPELASPASIGSKRPRDEDTQLDSGAAADSPKRPKTEWEGPPSEGLMKKQEVVENIETEEDASTFLEELIKLAAEGPCQDLSETLTTILKGCGAVPDASEHPLGLHTNGHRDSPPPSLPAADEFKEYFDFSSFGPPDDGDTMSIAPTPDLSSSSTNPSPESASETDTAGQLATTDLKPLDMSDPLQLGPWKEIDGGESAYYQQADWKWDSPMPTLEQPWAIFPT